MFFFLSLFFIIGCLTSVYPQTNQQEPNTIIFDVGANNGESFINLAKQNPSVIVYAFEPTPELCSLIQKKTQGMSNYHLIPKAVSNFEGQATFNVAGQADWGCSSLLKFSDKSRTDWPGRTDFVKTQEIQVEVICLERFVKENDIKTINHLHIDTQGSDLNVLRGLGNLLQIVETGVMEAATKPNILYYNQNEMQECVDFLIKNGFEIEKVETNDQFGNEVNIYFRRPCFSIMSHT